MRKSCFRGKFFFVEHRLAVLNKLYKTDVNEHISQVVYSTNQNNDKILWFQITPDDANFG